MSDPTAAASPGSQPNGASTTGAADVPGSGKFAELLALGEASLRRLADSTRQLQQALNRPGAGGSTAGSQPGAAANMSSVEQKLAQDALGRIKAGIFQMRELFQEVRGAGLSGRVALAPGKLQTLRRCLKAGGGVKSAVETALPVAGQTAKEALHRTENYLRKHPGKGLLACLGFGLLVGVLISR